MNNFMNRGFSFTKIKLFHMDTSEIVKILLRKCIYHLRVRVDGMLQNVQIVQGSKVWQKLKIRKEVKLHGVYENVLCCYYMCIKFFFFLVIAHSEYQFFFSTDFSIFHYAKHEQCTSITQSQNMLCRSATQGNVQIYIK